MSTQNVVDMYKNDRVTRRYSEGFKLKILAKLSTGKYSKRQLSNINGLKIIQTLHNPENSSLFNEITGVL